MRQIMLAGWIRETRISKLSRRRLSTVAPAIIDVHESYFDIGLGEALIAALEDASHGQLLD
jgi:hypothetical protein